MYSVNNQKYVNRGKLLNQTELIDLDGFLMSSKRKVFHIQNSDIREIRVMNKGLANPLASRKVFMKYNRLITQLTVLLTDDDDSGESCREALNHIEKFRLEIKNKYRSFLKQKELEMMSKQLITLKKEAERRFYEIQNSYLEYTNSHGRGGK